MPKALGTFSISTFTKHNITIISTHYFKEETLKSFLEISERMLSSLAQKFRSGGQSTHFSMDSPEMAML